VTTILSTGASCNFSTEPSENIPWVAATFTDRAPLSFKILDAAAIVPPVSIMSSNSSGKIFNFNTWGESHGKAIGCVVDGVPSKIELSEEDIQIYLNKRRPGQSKFTTQRKESDQVEILSGVFEGKTTGHPISLLINNEDQKTKDYSDIKDIFRPGHADYTYWSKYGIRDYRGGGRASARETAMRVAAGAIARKVIKNKIKKEFKITGALVQIGEIKINHDNWNEDFIEKNDFMEDPPKKYFRLSPGKEVRLKFAYFIKCNEVVKDENGDVVELHCTYDKNTKGGKSNDGRKVKGTLHWVSALHAISAEVRLYDRLFKSISPDTDANFLESINSDSLKILRECKVEPYLSSEIAEIPVQFERLGYFIRDSKSSKESLVFNRTVALRDTWKQ